MLKIITPATSANLGPGFDFLGIALNLYNVITFEISDKNKEIGFENVGENLVLKTYDYIMKKYGKKYVYVKITLKENGIPASHGLGSSASAIVSGMKAANYFLNNVLTEKELIDEMVAYEGHPDNILPCYFGGMVSSVIENNELYYFKHNVSENLIFNVLMPQYNVSTAKAREILPKKYDLKDVTYNASRAFILKEALEKGDFELLNLAHKDVIHEPYRKELIKEWKEIEKIANKTNSLLNISGSGPTMIAISKDDSFYKEVMNQRFDLNVKMLKIDKKGTQIGE